MARQLFIGLITEGPYGCTFLAECGGKDFY